MPTAAPKTVRVAVVQAHSVLLDLPATLAKADMLIKQAASEGARIIVFPEAFIGGYPRGLGFGTIVGSRAPEGKALFARYHDSTVAVPGPVIAQLGQVARQAKAHLVMGIVEKDAMHPHGTLYCTILYFGPYGALLGKHRKLKPTASERIIWGEGQMPPSVVETEFGRLGGLICWENYMPLARMALYQQGIDLYVAPTADNRESWQATIRHIACEGRCFVLACNQFIEKKDYPPELQRWPELQAVSEPFCRGGSAIIDPSGEYLAGPVWDKEDILVAELDLELLVKSRFDFDVTGHYARRDLFQFAVSDAQTKK